MSQVSSGKPICRPVNTALYHSPEYLSLSDTGQARPLLIFLLIHPHGGTFHLPGFYQTGPEAMRETLKMPRRLFLSAYTELKSRGIIFVDEAYRLIWMPCALRLVGPPINPNVVKGYCRSINQLPPSHLVATALPAYRTMLLPLGERFLQPFNEAFESLSEGFAEALGNASRSRSDAEGHNNTDKDSDFYPYQNTDKRAEKLLRAKEGAAIILYLQAYAHRVGWDSNETQHIEQHVRQNSDISLAELKECEPTLEAKKRVRNPLAYLFGIARRRRLNQSQQNSAREASTQNDFALFFDGQKATFDD